MNPAVDHISQNLDSIRQRVAAACARSGRLPSEIRLMAVSKTQPVEYMLEAFRLGLDLFGENRVQEGLAKRPLVPAGAEIQLIGHLQSNKAREAVQVFSAVQSIDKPSTVQALAKHLPAGKRFPVLLEVNTSEEASKDGTRTWDELCRLVESLNALPAIEVQGLMTMAPWVQEEGPIRRSFTQLRETRDRLKTLYPDKTWSVLSMGMSNDFELAIEEGSTLLRVGTLLFGRRQP